MGAGRSAVHRLRVRPGGTGVPTMTRGTPDAAHLAGGRRRASYRGRQPGGRGLAPSGAVADGRSAPPGREPEALAGISLRGDGEDLSGVDVGAVEAVLELERGHALADRQIGQLLGGDLGQCLPTGHGDDMRRRGARGDGTDDRPPRRERDGRRDPAAEQSARAASSGPAGRRRRRRGPVGTRRSRGRPIGIPGAPGRSAARRRGRRAGIARAGRGQGLHSSGPPGVSPSVRRCEPGCRWVNRTSNACTKQVVRIF